MSASTGGDGPPSQRSSLACCSSVSGPTACSISPEPPETACTQRPQRPLPHPKGPLQGVHEGISAAGGAAVDVGELPTPALYFATKTLPVDGGIQVTGSHNPPEFNGFKMVLAHDAVFGEDIQVLYRLINDGKLVTKPGGTSTAHRALLPAYKDAIVKRNAPLARRR